MWTCTRDADLRRDLIGRHASRCKRQDLSFPPCQRGHWRLRRLARGLFDQLKPDREPLRRLLKGPHFVCRPGVGAVEFDALLERFDHRLLAYVEQLRSDGLVARNRLQDLAYLDPCSKHLQRVQALLHPPGGGTRDRFEHRARRTAVERSEESCHEERQCVPKLLGVDPLISGVPAAGQTGHGGADRAGSAIGIAVTERVGHRPSLLGAPGARTRIPVIASATERRANCSSQRACPCSRRW